MQFQKFKVNEMIYTQMHLERENTQSWNFILCFLQADAQERFDKRMTESKI